MSVMWFVVRGVVFICYLFLGSECVRWFVMKGLIVGFLLRLKRVLLSVLFVEGMRRIDLLLVLKLDLCVYFSVVVLIVLILICVGVMVKMGSVLFSLLL